MEMALPMGPGLHCSEAKPGLRFFAALDRGHSSPLSSEFAWLPFKVLFRGISTVLKKRGPLEREKTPMAQAVDTSSDPNHTDAILDGIPRMNTWANEQQNCPKKVTANRLGLTLATLIHVPAQLSAVATSAMTLSPFLSSSQVTGKMKGMYVSM
ncbi:hypothetical protein INR49_017634 [Caranx melampygus]|nr:hypothetical protein INR49_017634 [Caranx melampygus]